MRKITIMALVLFMAASFSTLGFAQTPEESLKKAFPRLKFDRIAPSHMKGIYEVISGSEILYYCPETESVIVGEIIAKDGKNLTRDKQQQILSFSIKEKIKDIPLHKAVVVGKGTHHIIEITDPDCPYCRKASEFFSARTDVTRHIFLFPSSIHPQAINKVLYVLCAKDMAKAYEEAMTGKLDDMKFTTCESPEARELLKAHMNTAEQLGIRGTPFFFVNGQSAIFGADIPQLEKLLMGGK